MNRNFDTQQKEYETPRMEIILLEMEQGVAAASATVSPLDIANGTVKEEWDTEDQSGTIDW